MMIGSAGGGRGVVAAWLLALWGAVLCGVSHGEGYQRPNESVDPNLIIDANSIVALVFRVNPEVAAARYAQEAAEFQFKDFERNLSQFTPFISESLVRRDDLHPFEDNSYRTAIRAEKEFFDSSSAFAGVGHRGQFGDSGSASSQFVEGGGTVALASSNTTLRRITDRSREENEMFNARLEYVDTLRDSIQEAQERYFQFLETIKMTEYVEACIEDFLDLLESERARNSAADSNQIKSDIDVMRAERVHIKERIDVMVADLGLAIGSGGLERRQVEDFDFYAEDFYGRHYLERSAEELMESAARNDITIRVLKNARTSSIEKRRLALEGTWDAFLDALGEADVAGSGDYEESDGYSVFSALRADKIDSTLLKYSLGRALSEIKKYDALIRQQDLKTKNEITENLMIAKGRRVQYEKLLETIRSKESICAQKRRDYLEGRDTVDYLLANRKELTWLYVRVNSVLRDYYSSIAELDSACGVYFDRLGIEIEDF